MAPSATQTKELLRQAVYYHLDNLSYDNALFFAERLCAQDKSADSVYLQALCHFRLDDPRSAYEISKPLGYRGAHLGCAYVFAQASYKLERWRDGIYALEKSRSLWTGKNNIGKYGEHTRTPVPDGAACCCLLGKLHLQNDDKRRAVAALEEALKMNPLQWDAFTKLCDMGIAVTVPNIFKADDSLLHSFEGSTRPAATDQSAQPEPLMQRHLAQAATKESVASHDRKPLSAGDSIFGQRVAEGKDDFMSKINAARVRHGTETGSLRRADTAVSNDSNGTSQEQQLSRTGSEEALPHAASRRALAQSGIRRQGRTDTAGLTADPNAPLSRSITTITANDRKRTISGHPVQTRPGSADEPQRRSARLNPFKPAISKPTTSGVNLGDNPPRELRKARAPISRLVRPGQTGNTGIRVVSGNRTKTDESRVEIDPGEAAVTKENPVTHRPPLLPRQPTPEIVKIEESLKAILDLLRIIATGYQQLAHFQCKEALHTWSGLSRAQQESPWILAQMGRAHYEQASYADAEKYYRRLKLAAPARMHDMELYSTVLWHLRRETDLSFLAHELVDASWHSPQAWCALGNAWSLVSDHEQALKCFKRATQLAPKFAYAFTLQGHEHMANEEYEKALTAYRQAIAADKRHYNGYYGIGRVYEKLGSWEKAQAHYQYASQINPTNAVLMCCIGTALEKQGQVDLALRYFEQATNLAPRAAQTRFRKARALLGKGHLHAAQKELMIIKDLAPDDARVHFLLGKLFKASGEKGQAIRHFTQALSLDPKSSQEVKLAIESMEDDDGFDNSMVDG